MSGTTPDAFPTVQLDATEDDGSDTLGEPSGPDVDSTPGEPRDADDVS